MRSTEEGRAGEERLHQMFYFRARDETEGLELE